MLQLTLGVVWLGPLRHGFVTAGSSVVNPAPATFASAEEAPSRIATANVAKVRYRRQRRTPRARTAENLFLMSCSPSLLPPHTPCGARASGCRRGRRAGT